MPNQYLHQQGVKIGANSGMKSVIPVFAEGTGMMWPDQVGEFK